SATRRITHHSMKITSSKTRQPRLLAWTLFLIGIQVWGLMNCLAEQDSPKLPESLRVFSIVSKAKDKDADVWVEDFYLANDGKEAFSVTEGSIHATGVDRNGKAKGEGGFGIGGSNSPAYTVNPHEIWKFYTIKWEGAPSLGSSCGHASFADKRVENSQPIEVKSIARYGLYPYTGRR
ncbi:MAG: hypothetical protein NTW21_34905, partial [Verrucomicrobia bacterium]|nr:hypothetical protein [Verrucomicrobiota bacterium]